MKYYSEILEKPFDSKDECLKAEKDFKEQEEIKAKEQAERLANISKRKKDLSKAIEDADTRVIEANKLYEIAREKAKKILEESNKQVREIMDEAEANVREAEEAKLNAVMAFNKEFGKYTVTLTGEKAADEFNRSIQRFNRTLKDFFNGLIF